MSLENVQGFLNKQAAKLGNVAASNDPQQMKHDLNNGLIQAAKDVLAGEQLGMSVPDTMKAVSQRTRRMQSVRRQEDAVREFQQSQGTNGEFSGDGEIRGIGYQDEDELARTFGEDQSDYQNFRADDRGFTTDEETGLLRRETFDETRGEQVDFAPQNAVRDAYNQLEAASSKKDSLQQRLMGVFGGGDERQAAIARVMGRLEDDLRPDRGADAALGGEAVRTDSRRFNPEMQEYNNNRAEAESQSIARELFGGYGSGSMADDSIGRIAEIRSLGKIGETAHVVRTADDAIKGQITRRHDGVYLDPASGDPVAVQGPELPAALAGDRRPNTGNSDNNLNAPTTAREWVQALMPDYRDGGGRSFGDYPQVDITRETTNFANRVRDYGRRVGIGSLQNVSSNIRSVDELQKVAQIVSDSKTATGKSLMVRDPVSGRNTNAGGNLVGGLMNELRMSSGDEQRLANAMYQLDAAKRSSVNENPTGTYLSRMTLQGPKPVGQGDIVFDAPEAVGSDQVQVAQQRKGSKIEGRDIVSAMAGLSDPGAQKPFIGQAVGEKPRVNRRKPANMGSGDELSQNIRRQAVSRLKKGENLDEGRVRANQVKARLAEEREARDSRKRQEQTELIRSFTPANLRRAR